MMTFINGFLRSLEYEQLQTLYSNINSLFWVVFSVVFLVYIRKSQKISWLRLILVLAIPYAVNSIIMLFAGVIKTISDGIIPTFYPVYFVSIMCATTGVTALVLKAKFTNIMDKFVLSFFISRPCHCIACLIAGCCYGIDVDWGLYSYNTGTTVLPLRAFEILILVSLFFVGNWFYTHKKFQYDGQCAALGTIAFGAWIFIFDIFCTTPSKIFFHLLSAVGISASMTFIAGIIMLFVFSKKYQTERSLEQNQI